MVLLTNYRNNHNGKRLKPALSQKAGMLDGCRERDNRFDRCGFRISGGSTDRACARRSLEESVVALR
jgi:hypothetical protein